MTITEFVLARIAEDEATLRRWSRGVLDPEASEIEKRWQRERVLAECAVKRALVEQFDGERHGVWVLERLASVYADHPDYRQEWAV